MPAVRRPEMHHSSLCAGTYPQCLRDANGLAVGRCGEEASAGFLLRGKQDRIQWSIFPLRAGVLDRLNKRRVGTDATRTVHTSLIISHSVFSPCLGPTPRRHRRGHSLRQSRRKIIFEYALRTGCGSDVQVSRHKCRARYGLAAGSTTCEALSTCTQGASPSSFPAVVWVPTLL